MSRLKCKWDSIARPPEEKERFQRSIVSGLGYFGLVPTVIGVISVCLFFLFRHIKFFAILALFTLSLGVMFLFLYAMFAVMIRSKRYHDAVKLYLKEVNLNDAKRALEDYLDSIGTHYQRETPGKWSYRGYAFPPHAAYYIKEDLFLGIRYFMGPEKRYLRQISIYYRSRVWDEALILQKGMDSHFHQMGMALPFEEGKSMVFTG